MHKRLSYFIKNQKLSVTKFEEKINTSSGTISKCLRTKTAITTTVLEKISESFPELNIDWLITGRGEMLNGKTADPIKDTKENDSDIIPNTTKKPIESSSFAEAVHRFFEAVTKLEDKTEQLYDVKSELLEANEKILVLTEENKELRAKVKENNL